MNPELDLDDLELEEETDEVAEEVPAKRSEKPDPIDTARGMVIDTIGQNVFDRDLEQSLLNVVNTHFDTIANRDVHQADIFQIPDLNMKIWDAFHDYESFIYKGKFENIDLNEIAKILREQVVPKITRDLWDLTIRQSQ